MVPASCQAYLGKQIFPRALPGAPTSHLCPCSYNSENFIYLADFPKELSIKYLVNSFYGDTAIVTETEEVGCPAPLPTSFMPTPKSQGFPFFPCQGKGAQERERPQGPRGRATKAPFIAENPQTQKG